MGPHFSSLQLHSGSGGGSVGGGGGWFRGGVPGNNVLKYLVLKYLALVFWIILTHYLSLFSSHECLPVGSEIPVLTHAK